MVDSSALGLLVRLVFSLAVVIGLMLLLAHTMRKRGLIVGASGVQRIGGGAQRTGRGAPRMGGGVQRFGGDIEVLSRRGLGRSAQVAVVRAGGRTLVLGVTEQHICLLADADTDAMAHEAEIEELEHANAQRTARTGFTGYGTNPPWRMLINGVRDRTVRH